jgi:hypothetical protein
VPLDHEHRAQFRAKLHLQRRPGRLTITAAQLGRVMVDMLGDDGRLDPSHETLAPGLRWPWRPSSGRWHNSGRSASLDWARRLARRPDTGWRVEQTSNAYLLRVPTCDAQFARPVRFPIKKEAPPVRQPLNACVSAAQQLLALGFPVPAGWGLDRKKAA